MNFTLSVLVVAVFLTTAGAGPIALGLCYTACNAAWVVCCTAAASVAGEQKAFSRMDLSTFITAGTYTGGAAVPAALATCSTIQGTCMATCSPLFFAPTL